MADENKELKVGDVVRLKSGGSIMTIDTFNDAKSRANCVFYSPCTCKFEELNISVNALKLDVPDQPKTDIDVLADKGPNSFGEGSMTYPPGKRG